MIFFWESSDFPCFIIPFNNEKALVKIILGHKNFICQLIFKSFGGLSEYKREINLQLDLGASKQGDLQKGSIERIMQRE